MRVAYVAAAVLTGLAAAVVATAGVDPQLLKAVKTLLKAGDAKSALRFLDQDGARQNLLADLPALREVCSDLASEASSLARQKEDAPKLAALVEGFATAAVEGNGSDADAQCSLAYARLASGRVARAAGVAGLTAEPWTGAADAFEKAYEAKPGAGIALADASSALAEAADIPGADPTALMRRAADLSAKALQKHPDSVFVLKAASLLDLARARRALAAKDKASAEALLEQGLARLAPNLKGASPDLDLATAHNEIVAFLKANAKDLKKPKGEFLVTNQKIGTTLQVDVPTSRFWSLSEDATRLFQFTTSFEALRTLFFDTYDWDTNWSLADGTKVGGDNLKGLATNQYEISLRGLKTVKSKKAPVKGRLNGKLDEGYAYEIEGVDRDGDYAFERTWYFKSKAGHQTTFRVTLFDHRQDSVQDAVSRAVLDSIHEVPKR